MSRITPEVWRELSERAKTHYTDALPYHNWEHALDVMNTVADLADRSISPEVAGKRDLLVVAAAWHDADYHIESLGLFQTKEARSADLAARLLPELSDQDKALLVSGIIDTTVNKNPKDTLFGEVLHAADVGYFAAPTDHFMDRLVLMRQEWGSTSWEITVDRTLRFGKTVLADAQELMPKILSGSDADAWTSRIESNLMHLQTELTAGNLTD